MDDLKVGRKHSVLVVERVKQKMIARARKDGPARRLKNGCIARDIGRHVEAEILSDQRLAAEVFSRQSRFHGGKGVVGAVALEDAQRCKTPGIAQSAESG